MLSDHLKGFLFLICQSPGQPWDKPNSLWLSFLLSLVLIIQACPKTSSSEKSFLTLSLWISSFLQNSFFFPQDFLKTIVQMSRALCIAMNKTHPYPGGAFWKLVAMWLSLWFHPILWCLHLAQVVWVSRRVRKIQGSSVSSASSFPCDCKQATEPLSSSLGKMWIIVITT